MQAMAALLEKAQRGDAAAFCEVARQHEDVLFRQACALCRDQHAAEDLVQETLLEAWKGVSRYDGTCRFSTWLYAILLHRYQKSRRKCCAVPSASGNPPDSEGCVARADADPVEAASAGERKDELRAAIAALPDEHRDVIRLRFFAGASLDEIAAALAIPLGTVKSRLHNGLLKLRQVVDSP